jgi:hypothetical protein
MERKRSWDSQECEDDARAKYPRQDELESNFSNVLATFADERQITGVLHPGAVGKKFTVMYVGPYNESDCGEVGWQCGATLRSVSMNSEGHPEFSFLYDVPPAGKSAIMKKRITAPDRRFWLFPATTNRRGREVSIFRPGVREDVRTLLEALGNRYLGAFGDYYQVREQLTEDKKGTKFLVLHNHYSGWAAYEATFQGIQEGLVPQFEFIYDNSGDGPYFSTDDSQLPDSQLPHPCIGAHLNYFLFSS